MEMAMGIGREYGGPGFRFSILNQLLNTSPRCPAIVPTGDGPNRACSSACTLRISCSRCCSAVALRHVLRSMTWPAKSATMTVSN